MSLNLQNKGMPYISWVSQSLKCWLQGFKVPCTTVERTEVRFKLRSNATLTEQTVVDLVPTPHNHSILLCVTLELLFEMLYNNNSEIELIRYPLPIYSQTN